MAYREYRAPIAVTDDHRTRAAARSKLYRKSYNMSQRALALALKTHCTSISDLEREYKSAPGWLVMAALAFEIPDAVKKTNNA